ncbi:DNA-binding protein [Sphingomonas oleivorans]|uniref:DNA-binding protein n=1 Tax=Sphingomonas oleivorans TaxID=1735121 RepID=A0A2T5G1C7_9SPHN|nr:AlpA family transcriptional regulator [Sphingomonas oleivorans]PTQ12920.1 DNA-binding protein [Sphingomonas oleivorans]
MTENDRLVRLPEVMNRTGLSRTTIYRRMGEGTFPARVPLGRNSVAWYESDIRVWVSNPTAWIKAA